MRLELFLVAVVAAGSGGYALRNQMYEGTKRPEVEVSVLYAPKGVVILTVDDQNITEGWLRTIVHALPGKHRVVIGANATTGSGNARTITFGEPVALEWEALPGHWYSCEALVDESTKTWRPLIEDRTQLRQRGELQPIVADSGY